MNINIGFVIDDNYVKYCSVVIASILHNSKNNEQFSFHIVHDGSISDISKAKLKRLSKIKDFEINYYAQNAQLHHEQRKDTRSDIPMVTNYRMMISSILKDVDKIIFMDADLIIVDSLSELWNTYIDEYYMACCPAPKGSLDDYQAELDIPQQYNYCNTGVMLANLKKWRNDNIEEKLFEKEILYRGKYKFYDQCIFNITLYDKIFYLNQKFNFRPAIWDNKELFKTIKSPVIIHWAQPFKPWNDNKVKYFNEYKKYAVLSPYEREIYQNLSPETRKSFSEKLFSIKNKNINSKKYKVLTIAGIKIKIRIKNKIEKLLSKKYSPKLTLEEKKLILEDQFRHLAGYEPNIDNPQSFNEKIQYLKLYNEDPLLTKCSDKYLAREYIKEKIGGDYVVPLLGVWNSADEIDFEKLPNRFVLKVNWGSGQNIIVKDKSKLNIIEAKTKLNKWMKPHSNHYYHSFEWGYKNIRPKIIAEKYIEQTDGPVYDYKFFCFNGKAKVMYIAIDSFDYSIMKINYYDTDFNKLDLVKHYPNAETPLKKPIYWDKMIELSEKLSQNFVFARIDFFDTGEKLYVGEITFYPGAGTDKFEPLEWDYRLGAMLDLSSLKESGGGKYSGLQNSK